MMITQPSPDAALTYSQAQHGGVVLPNPDPKLCSFWDGFGNPVVDVTVKLEDVHVVFFLTACIPDIPRT